MHKKQIALFIFLNSLLILMQSCNTQQSPDTGFTKLKNPTDTIVSKAAIANIRAIQNELFDSLRFVGKDSIAINYRLLQPPGSNDPSRKFPLVLVFHGSGAIGNDNKSQLGVLAKLWASPAIQKEFPAFVVVPQFPGRSSNYIHDSSRGVLKSVPQPCLYPALALIDSLKNVLNIDENRIYAIGFSMGASTVLNALSLRPTLFAAGISIAGIPQFDSISNLSGIPIWLVHGNKDTENTIQSDALFFREITAMNKNKTRFWELEAVGHDNVFSELLLGRNIPSWLFTKSKH